MADQVSICNVAATLLGAAPITAITDNTNVARTFNALWDITRDKELRAHYWKFSIARAKLPALGTIPANGPYTQQFALPSGCLRVLDVGDSFPNMDMSDFRSGVTTGDYSIEGNLILSNLPAPLPIRYVNRVTDPTQFDSCFAEAFAAKLAWYGCFRITNSNEMKKQAVADYRQAILDGIRANALESPSQYIGDDTWISSRMGGAGSPSVVNW